MKPSHDRDLIDISMILESFRNKLELMTEADRIDLAARLKPAAKSLKEIDDAIKADLKAKFNGLEGFRLGKDFRAVFKVVSVEQFQQKAFKEAKPALAAQFTETVEQERITFELR